MTWQFYLVAGCIGLLYFGSVFFHIVGDWPKYKARQAQRGITASKNVQLSITIAALTAALFVANIGLTDYKEKNIKNGNIVDTSSLAGIVKGISDADKSVETSHRILMEAFEKLDSKSSPKELSIILRTDVYRCLKAEALHCQRANDKLSAINASIISADFDPESKRDLAEILGLAQDAYSTRRSSLLKTADAIDSIDFSSQKMSSPAFKKAIAEIRSGQDKAQRTAFLLAAFCSKHGISPDQN